MRLIDFTILSNERIARDVYCLRLSPGVNLPPPKPGCFVNIQLDGFYLRRPISVCDWGGKRLTLIYKVVGEGTKSLAKRTAGRLSLLCWLGNGYTVADTKRPVLIGGGVGVPPLYYLAKELLQAGQRPVAILGFNCAEEVFYQEEFGGICETVVTTADGSLGVKGFVTNALANLDYDALYTCGPEPMLKAVYRQAKDVPAQFSFERRMGCGFGACMACSCKTVTGCKRVCMDGPILTKEEILWT